MIRAAKKRKFKPALAGDGLDRRERLIQFLQNWTLFDKKLKIAQGIVHHFSLRNLAGIQPEVFDSLSHRDALCIANIQKFKAVKPASSMGNATDEPVATEPEHTALEASVEKAA